MSSLFLGNIGNGSVLYEIHAFTNGLPFSKFNQSQISDSELYRRLLHERFKLMGSGVPIICTAINPDGGKQEEYNPHDDRPGTFHLAAIDSKTGNIVFGQSLAVDIGDEERGELIGLPIENRWRSGIYPKGLNLDLFRERYTALNHESRTRVKPWQMVELYRGFKPVTQRGDLTSRIGVYTGAYHLLVREARRKETEPTYIWVLDAIPKYFNLYRWAGAAVLLEHTVANPPRHISPNINSMEERTIENRKCIIYDNKVISRNCRVQVPSHRGAELDFIMEDFAILDGVVDIYKLEHAVKVSPIELTPVKYEGMTDEDMNMLRTSLSVLGKRQYEDCHSNDQSVIATNNELTKYLATCLDFNEIGS